MSQNVLTQPVLVLNKHWQAINDKATVESALIDMTGGKHGIPSKLALDVELVPDGNGGYILGSSTRPVEWSEWITLPVRTDHHDDRAVHTHRYTWRAPTVIICKVYDDMPVKTMRWSTGNVRIRDNGVCQVTGRKLSHKEGNVGHLKARAHGGTDSWENTVYMDRQLNTLQGTRTVEEMGWKLIRKPKAPPKLPASVTITEARHITWLPFLIR